MRSLTGSTAQGQPGKGRWPGVGGRDRRHGCDQPGPGIAGPLGAVSPNLRDLGVDRGPLTGGDAARSGLGWRVEWLLEGQRDGGAEQLEGAGLDGGGAGELLDLLPGEDDGLPVEGGQVLKQVAVAIGG